MALQDIASEKFSNKNLNPVGSAYGAEYNHATSLLVQKLSAYYGKPLWLILAQDISDENIPEGKELLYKRLINQIKELSKEVYE